MSKQKRVHILFTLPMLALFLVLHTYPLIRGADVQRHQF